MTFGNQQLVKKMNELMLEYAEDIVPIERDNVVRFFEQQRIPYREDYIDFLARFGGNQSDFFEDFNCTFEKIVECYLEEPEDELPPKGYCLFTNHIVSDFYFIENKTGKIYCEHGDHDGRQIPETESYQNIDTFLWNLLYSRYSDYFITEYSKKEFSRQQNCIDKYFSENYSDWEFFEIPNSSNRISYLKGNKLYFYYKNRREDEYYVHTLSDDFVARLYA